MHEQGGRHKESVEKRIRETSKRQAEESARDQDVKAMLEQMNRVRASVIASFFFLHM